MFALVAAGPAFAGFEEGAAAYQRGDYAAAFAEWQPLAEAGDAVAQFHLALLYWNGEGVAQNDSDAVEWSRKAAAQGHVDAEAFLGTIYLTGRSIPRDCDQAVRWLTKA